MDRVRIFNWAQVEALQRKLEEQCRLGLERQQEIERLQQQVAALQKRNRELEAAAANGRPAGAVPAGSAAGDAQLPTPPAAPSIAKIPLDPQRPARGSSKAAN